MTLKQNGLEMGKVDQRLRNGDNSFILPGGQRFLYTNSTPYPIGNWYKLRVRQLGGAITIWVNDALVTTFTDGPGSTNWNAAESILTSGAWAYYHEDARVEFDDGPVVPSVTTPPSNNDVINLTITSSPSSIALSWSPPPPPSGTVQGYNVYLNGVKNNGAPESWPSYTLTGLNGNTSYTIIVKTVVGGVESGGVTRVVTTTGGSTAPLVNVSTVAQLTDALASATASQTI